MTTDSVSPAAFRRLLTRAVAAPPALLVVLAAVFLVQILYLLSASRWVDHSDRVIAGANGLLTLLLDGETGMRGYLVTGDPLFLEPYRVEEAGIGQAFRQLIDLVSDNRAQAGRLEALEAAHEDWRAFAQRLIALREEGGDYAATVRNGEGKRRMDAMRAGISAFIAAEERLRDARNEAVQGATRIVIATSLGLALSLGIGLAYLTRRHLAAATASYRESLDETSRLAAIVESSEDAIIGKTLDGIITSWSPGAAALYGYSASEAIGQPASIVIPPDLSDELPAILARIARGERVEPFETRRPARDGRRIDVWLTISPVKDRGGAIIGAAAIARDITAANQASEALERLARRLEALHEIDRAILGAESLERLVSAALERLVRVLPCQKAAVALIDEEDGRATVVASTQGRDPGPVARLPLAGLPAAANLRRGARQAVTLVAGVDRLDPVWARILCGEGSRLAALPLRDEGDLRGILYLSASRPGDFGDEQQAIGLEVADQLSIALQQTEYRRRLREHAVNLERRVEERTAQLQETNAALEAFSYTISHDLRAPLRAMEGIAQAIVEDFGDRLGPAGLDYAGRVVASARQMDALIRDLLDYSRLSRADLRPQVVDLAAAIREALEQLDGEIRARDAEVSASEPMPTVLAHGPTLVQVVVNLVGNALKFIAPGERPRVRLRAERRDGHVRLWVEDNGLGIAPLHRDRIFGVLERLHGDEAYPGTGIGLAIVKKGVERIGGRVGVESAEGRGSRFWIELAEARQVAADECEHPAGGRGPDDGGDAPPS